MQELWFLCMTRCLNVLYKCMKFCRNICNGYQVIERTRFCDGQTDTHTHRPTDRRKGKNNMSPDPFRGGDIIETFAEYHPDVKDLVAVGSDE